MIPWSGMALRVREAHLSHMADPDDVGAQVHYRAALLSLRRAVESELESLPPPPPVVERECGAGMRTALSSN